MCASSADGELKLNAPKLTFCALCNQPPPDTRSILNFFCLWFKIINIIASDIQLEPTRCWVNSWITFIQHKFILWKSETRHQNGTSSSKVFHPPQPVPDMYAIVLIFFFHSTITTLRFISQRRDIFCFGLDIRWDDVTDVEWKDLSKKILMITIWLLNLYN